MTRKLGQGRLSTELRARMVGDATIDLPYHELELVPITRDTRSELSMRYHIPMNNIPRAAYGCIHCDGMWLRKDRRVAENETCPSRSRSPSAASTS